jgi:hypothetical protein
MNNILKFDDLENTVETILLRAKKKNQLLYDYMFTLKNFGFRPVEALESSRFNLINISNFTFKPAKKNNIRILNPEIIPANLWYYYFGNSLMYQPYYYKRFQRNLKDISPSHNYQVDGKSLGLYIFRYYYVRKLYMDGMSFEDITSHMGWKNQYMAFKYLTRNITIS